MSFVVSNISYAEAARRPAGSVPRSLPADGTLLHATPTASPHSNGLATDLSPSRSLSTLPLELLRRIIDFVIEPPFGRQVVYAQPEHKWSRHWNPDFQHGVYRVSKLFRHQAICQLLDSYTINFDTTEDLEWLEAWANKYGVAVDVAYHLKKLMFVEFDRYGQHAAFYDFLTRVVRANRLQQLQLRFSVYKIEDRTAESIIETWHLGQLRAMRGLKEVTLYMWEHGVDVYDNPELLKVQEWLAEAMCKPKGSGKEDAGLKLPKPRQMTRIVPAVPDWSKLEAKMAKL